MAERHDLTVIGDLNVDLILANPERLPALGQEVLVQDAHLTLGGSAALLAAAAARLGVSVRLAARVGDDVFGRFCLAELATAGVDTSLIVVDPHRRTGVSVSLTWPRDRAFLTYSGPGAEFSLADVSPLAFSDTRHLHVSSFFLNRALRPGCAGLFRQAHAHGLTTSLDTGDDPADRWDDYLAETLREVDLFLPNEREATRIARAETPREALDRLSERIPDVVVKLGPDGAIARLAGRPLRVDAFPVQAIDTTGAGDAFDAGYLAAMLRGEPPERRLLYAAAAGALATTWLGGSSSRLSAAAVARLVNGNADERR